MRPLLNTLAPSTPGLSIPDQFGTSFFALVHWHLSLLLKSDQLGEIAIMAFRCLRNSTPLSARRHENRIQNRRWNQTECKKAYRRSLRRRTHNRHRFDIVALIRNRGGLASPNRRNQYVRRDNGDCDPLIGRLIGSHRFRSYNEAR